MVEITLEWLYRHVHKDEDGCLIWAGPMTTAGQPQASLRVGDERKTILVRREIWKMVHDYRPLPSKMRVYAKCEKEGCVHPDCIKTRGRGAVQKGVKKPLAVKIKIAMARRAQSQFDHTELIEAIKSSDETNLELAARLGCNHSYVSKIRRGQARKEYNSPFAGLLA